MLFYFTLFYITCKIFYCHCGSLCIVFILSKLFWVVLFIWRDFVVSHHILCQIFYFQSLLVLICCALFFFLALPLNLLFFRFFFWFIFFSFLILFHNLSLLFLFPPSAFLFPPLSPFPFSPFLSLFPYLQSAIGTIKDTFLGQLEMN